MASDTLVTKKSAAPRLNGMNFSKMLAEVIIIIIIIMLQLENANKEATQAEDKLATTLYILQARLLSITKILNL